MFHGQQHYQIIQQKDRIRFWNSDSYLYMRITLGLTITIYSKVSVNSMPREILFRGKKTDTGQWVYGGYLQVHYGDGEIDHYIIEYYPTNNQDYGRDEKIKIDEFSIGQFTGLKNEIGIEIFEGDIVKVPLLGTFEIKMDDTGCGCHNGFGWPINTEEASTATILGNIHDHPHLLK